MTTDARSLTEVGMALVAQETTFWMGLIMLVEHIKSAIKNPYTVVA